MRKLHVTLCAAVLALGLALSAFGQEAEGEKESENADPGVTRVVKNYASMTEEAVFQLSNEERTASVRFSAVVEGPLERAPRSIVRFRVGRLAVLAGYAFQTQGEIVCLVQQDDEFLMRRAANLIKGQNVVIEGVVLPSRSGYKLLLVDDIKLSGTEKRDVTWEIIINWPDERPKKITQPGKYTIRVPNPDAKGKFIEFEVEVRELKVVGAGTP